jgi:hypothetical protein
VASCRECGDEPTGSGTMKLVINVQCKPTGPDNFQCMADGKWVEWGNWY